ncbi:T9SS type A sorting domain-containing protein [candidate division KSB1 bacterium]|nr:T9SS type A sorting domain-containing protein [candidate division KSB1 bacterium]
MSHTMKIAIGLLAVLTSTPLWAAWPGAADTNLVICDRTGEQATPKVMALSDGGCYVCWYDWASGNWDVYLQRLGANGVPQWAHNGILISHHPQESWITDFDLAVDDQDYAIVAINDIRAGGDRDIYAYRVSPAGELIWGADGLTLSDNGDFEPDPRICVTTSGSIVFAWQQAADAGNMINLRRVTPNGQDEWSPAVRTLTSAYGVSIPRVVSDSGDGVIVQYLVHRGSQIWSPKHIFAQRFDALGEVLWGDTGVVVSSAGGLGMAAKPELIPDLLNGAYCYWYDSHDANRLHVYAQHLQSDGSPEWALNGVQASLAANELQMDPAAAFVGETGDLILYYMTADLNQSTWGLGGQAIRAGARQWGDNGIAFEALSSQQRLHVRAVAHPQGTVCVFEEFVPGSGLHSLVKAFRADTQGGLTWPGSPRTLCSVVSEKGRMNAALNSAAMTIAVWSDKRNDSSGDIYVQNVNVDGSLGDANPNQPPASFNLIAPADDDTLQSYEFACVWHASTDPDGDDVRYSLQFHVYYGEGFDVTFADVADTIRATSWEEITGLPEHDYIAVDWWVSAIAGGDTVRSTEVWRFVIPQQGTAEDLPVVPRAMDLLTAYPNPFNPSTTIRLSLEGASRVSIAVYDVTGRRVAQLHEGLLPAGEQEFTLDATGLTAGVYFCRMASDAAPRTVKLLLLR